MPWVSPERPAPPSKSLSSPKRESLRKLVSLSFGSEKSSKRGRSCTRISSRIPNQSSSPRGLVRMSRSSVAVLGLFIRPPRTGEADLSDVRERGAPLSDAPDSKLVPLGRQEDCYILIS